MNGYRHIGDQTCLSVHDPDGDGVFSGNAILPGAVCIVAPRDFLSSLHGRFQDCTVIFRRVVCLTVDGELYALAFIE